DPFCRGPRGGAGLETGATGLHLPVPVLPMVQRIAARAPDRADVGTMPAAVAVEVRGQAEAARRFRARYRSARPPVAGERATVLPGCGPATWLCRRRRLLRHRRQPQADDRLGLQGLAI